MKDDYRYAIDERPPGLYRYDDLNHTRTTMFFYHCSSNDHMSNRTNRIYYDAWFVCIVIHPDKWSSNKHNGPGQWWPVSWGDEASIATKVFSGEKCKGLRRSSPLEFLLVTGKPFREEDVRQT